MASLVSDRFDGPDPCVPVREVILRFRHRRTKKVKKATVVCPVRWTRGRMLDYARRCHPNETVVIEVWESVGRQDNPWEPRLWMVNPKEM